MLNSNNAQEPDLRGLESVNNVVERWLEKLRLAEPGGGSKIPKSDGTPSQKKIRQKVQGNKFSGLSTPKDCSHPPSIRITKSHRSKTTGNGEKSISRKLNRIVESKSRSPKLFHKAVGTDFTEEERKSRHHPRVRRLAERLLTSGIEGAILPRERIVWHPIRADTHRNPINKLYLDIQKKEIFSQMMFPENIQILSQELTKSSRIHSRKPFVASSPKKLKYDLRLDFSEKTNILLLKNKFDETMDGYFFPRKRQAERSVATSRICSKALSASRKTFDGFSNSTSNTTRLTGIPQNLATALTATTCQVSRTDDGKSLFLPSRRILQDFTWVQGLPRSNVPKLQSLKWSIPQGRFPLDLPSSILHASSLHHSLQSPATSGRWRVM